MIVDGERLSGPYVTDGVQDDFTFDFKVFAASDIAVIAGDDTLTLTTDYSVSVNADQDTDPGGSITLVTPADYDGPDLYISGSTMPYVQSNQFTNTGGFYPSVLNAALDRLTILVQQLRDRSARALVAPLGETIGPLPSLADRKGTVMGFDPITGDPSAAFGNDFAETLAAYRDAAAASAALAAVYGSGTLPVDPLTLTPYHFGAVGDGVTDDALAFQAMFDYLTNNNICRPINLAGGHFWIGEDAGDGLILPLVTGLQTCVVIDGGGATLELGPTNTTLFKRMAATATEANTLINAGSLVIKNLTMIGEAADGQIAMDISCVYGGRFENIHILGFDYGFLGTWMLNCLYMNLRYTNPVLRSMVIQSGGTDFRTGLPRWTDGSNSFHASNVNTLINCRVYGAATQTHAFSFYQADALEIINCISEGNSTGIDLLYDYQDSTNVRNLNIDGFHCEAPNSKLNLRIRHSGIARIRGLRRSFATPICDASGSQTGLSIIFEDLIGLGNMPAPAGPHLDNPNGRWFFHSDGGGIGGVEAGTSAQTEWRFMNCNIATRTLLSNAAVWENAHLPMTLSVFGFESGGTGVADYTTTARTFYGSAYLFESAVKFNTDDTYRFGQNGRPIALYVGTEGIIFKDSSLIKRLKAGYATRASSLTVPAGSTASFTFPLGTTITSGASNTLWVQPSTSADNLATAALGISTNCPTTTTGQITFANPTGADIIVPAGTVFRFNLIGHEAI